MTYTSPHTRSWAEDDFERREAEQAEVDAEEETRGESVDWVRLLAEFNRTQENGER